MNKTAAVIGSGFGGLSIALRLLSEGYKVTIFEKNSSVGGHASQYKEKGYTFDMGPSIITLPFLIDELFQLFGEDRKSYLDLQALDPYYRIYFHDKTYIDYSGDENQMVEQLTRFNTKDGKAYYSFMRYSKNLYKSVILDGLGSKPFLSMFDFIGYFPKALITGAILPSYWVVARFFKDFRARFLFSFHALFIGGNPFITPSVFLMLPYLEKDGGVWFTKGGMYSVVEALSELFKKNGGVIKTNTEVTEIVVEDDAAKGVRVGPEFYSFDIVVSNSHFANTYLDLLKGRSRGKWKSSKIKKMHYSMSCVVLYLGIKKQYPQLLHHTLIISKRYKGLIQDIFKSKVLPDDFSMYLHAPSRTDKSMAPEGCESLYLLVPVPNLAANIDWDVEAEPFSNKIIDFLENSFGLENLRNNIEVQKVFTPLNFRTERNNYLGACWSLQPRYDQIASLRPHNKAENIKNLYFVGASVHPGGGVPGVILSAKATHKIILNDYGDKK
ncbi:phytoene desaturase [Candidatus Nomurabacteria bacterium]|uniref:Phytoene desaturase n=1 Tax=candidate division WWE3 bacterium TaxID=2053526 RepID=A0A955DZN3_UNCKA|nr:phytoene desaturase [candidate division WWE3 bacterium]MCB9824023.1 phytoene desaturase [Candidatus Nomurabacteria bacterium]MCB9827006.1 phytoene desaturase [Candidatus Nomurabacteria bacterium]MCB9827964.1 phytoene desaturase [Candidatus Nomurabacteria bacterium]HXK52813.1 phytoene desaturase family protein [bacterium]